MPKQSRTKKSRRAAITQQETFRFGPKIEPAARPLQYDTRVRPQSQEGGALDALLTGLGLAGDIVEKGARYKKAVVDPAQREAGAISAAKGEALNEDATEAFIEGYEEMKGRGEGYNQLEAVLNEHYNENAGATPEEFAITQDNAIKEFFAGRTKSFIKGALPGAISLQKEYAGQYRRDQQEQFELDRLATSRQNVDAGITQSLKEGGDATAMRGLLNRLQMEGKDVGLSKMDISRQMVDLLGRRAEESGNSDMLTELSQMKGPDGIRLIDNKELADQVRLWEDRAAQTRRDMQSMTDKRIEKAKKEAKEAVTSKIAVLIDTVGNDAIPVEERMEAARITRKEMQSAYNKGLLTDEDIRKFEKGMDVVLGADGLFASTSNVRVKINALAKADKDPNSITAAYLESIQPHLTRKDVEAVWKASERSFDERRKNGNKKSVHQSLFEEMDKAFSKKVAIQDPITKSFTTPNGPDKMAEYLVQRQLHLEAWRQESGKAWPTDPKERKQIIEDSIEATLAQFPDEDLVAEEVNNLNKELDSLSGELSDEQIREENRRSGLVKELDLE